jgi:hypothetical protein
MNLINIFTIQSVIPYLHNNNVYQHFVHYNHHDYYFVNQINDYYYFVDDFVHLTKEDKKYKIKLILYKIVIHIIM